MDNELRQQTDTDETDGEVCVERDETEQQDADPPATTDQSTLGEPARLGIWFVSAYRKYISPALPPSCRYRPTCSAYTLQAIRKYGLLKGGWLGIKRICRCHPFHSGGHDPVP